MFDPDVLQLIPKKRDTKFFNPDMYNIINMYIYTVCKYDTHMRTLHIVLYLHKLRIYNTTNLHMLYCSIIFNNS